MLVYFIYFELALAKVILTAFRWSASVCVVLGWKRPKIYSKRRSSKIYAEQKK